MAPARLAVGFKSSHRYRHFNGAIDQRWARRSIARLMLSTETGSAADDDAIDSEDEWIDDNDENLTVVEQNATDQQTVEVDEGEDVGCHGNVSCCLVTASCCCCCFKATSPSSARHRSSLCRLVLRNLSSVFFHRRRRPRHFLRFPIRRRPCFVVLVLSLFLSLTALKVYTTSVAYGPYPDYQARRTSNNQLTNAINRGPPSDLLSLPDCDAIVAGDEDEIRLTRTMLYRETRRRTTLPPIGRRFNCSTWTTSINDLSVNVEGRVISRILNSLRVQKKSTMAMAVHQRPAIAYLITADVDSSTEQTAILLGAIYAVSNVYCIAMETDRSPSRDFRQAFRHVACCHRNVFTSDDDFERQDDVDCLRPCRQCDRSIRSNCTCSPGDKKDGGRKSGRTSLSADLRCIEQLITADTPWSYLIKLSTFHLPVQSVEFVAERLEQLSHRQQTGIDALEFVHGRAYGRQSVEQLYAVERRQVVDPSQFSDHSPDASTNISELSLPSSIVLSSDKYCTSEKNTLSGSVEYGLSKPHNVCFHTVSDLTSLFRQREVFAYPFNINRDHMAIKCLLHLRFES